MKPKKLNKPKKPNKDNLAACIRGKTLAYEITDQELATSADNYAAIYYLWRSLSLILIRFAGFDLSLLHASLRNVSDEIYADETEAPDGEDTVLDPLHLKRDLNRQ